MLRVAMYLWALPVTLIGLLVVLIARSSGGVQQRVNGVLEAAGGWPARVLRHGFPFSGSVAAITLGHVVVGVSLAALDATRAHERAHVRQFERWGLLMLVLYPLAGLIAALRGGNPYIDNVFEREARAAEVAAPMQKTAQSAGGWNPVPGSPESGSIQSEIPSSSSASSTVSPGS